MPPSILVIHGVTQTSEWYLEELKKSDVLIATNAHLKLVDFAYGDNPDPVITALDSGEHTAAIVCDLSFDQVKFIARLGTALKRFVFENGGRLAFPTTEGLLLIPVLKTLFQVPWNEGAYGSGSWGPCPDAAARLDITFPIRNFLPNATPASCLTFYEKACSFVNVQKEDRCFLEIHETDDESLSSDDPDAQVATRREDPYGDKCLVSVAMRTCGHGKICFFGDVNAQQPTPDLVFAFCLA